MVKKLDCYKLKKGVRNLRFLTTCKAISPRCTVGSRQAEHESHRESMEEDDMVMR